jgi:hypothetical protein
VRRLLEAINAIVESTVGRKLDYHALYPCSVATQAADGTLDLIPDDARIKGSGTSGIKLRHGLPGFVATVPAGARVLMGFEAGDPKRPYAMAWDAGSVTSVTFDGGSEDVARTNDLCGELYMDITSAPVEVLYYRSVGVGGPGVWLPVVTGAVGAPTPAIAGTPISIETGNTKLKA